jgi:hypothetical protein
VCWSIVVKVKPIVGSPFSGALHSDHICNATKDVNVHFFIRSSKSSKLHQPSEGTFEVTTRTNYTSVWKK